MSDYLKTFKALMDARGGAGHQFEKTYNPAARFGLQKPARDITLWGKPEAVRTDNKLLQALNPNAFRDPADPTDLPAAPSLGTLLGAGPGAGLGKGGAR